MLSGGASLGKYHLGVGKPLYEQDLLPRIIVGSSVGAFSASLVCSFKYSELPQIFDPKTEFLTSHSLKQNFTNIFECIDLLLKGKPVLDAETLKNAVRNYTKDLTFYEIYEENKWNLNITVT